jgi:tetratricopeptide (TPR) repeat protein
MGFWKSFFGGETDPEEEKKKAAARNFDLLKYDGVKAMRIGQFDYAVNCFEKALETKEDPEVRDYLSRALIQTGRLDEAMQQLQLMMRLLPTVVDVKVQAASVAFMMEDYDLMAEISEQALKQMPNEPMLHLLYAKAEMAVRHTCRPWPG